MIHFIHYRITPILFEIAFLMPFTPFTYKNVIPLRFL
jgi:hypothetical protein